MSKDFGLTLVNALGLPKNTCEFTIKFKGGELVTVDCKSYLIGENLLTEELSKLKFVEEEDGTCRLTRRMDSSDEERGEK